MLDRKLLRDLRRSAGLLAAIASIIAVGITCYVALTSSYRNLSEAKARYYRKCRMADFWIDVKKVPLAELSAVSSIPGVAEIQPRIQFSATVDLEENQEPITAMVISLPESRDTPLNDIVLRQGDYFTGRRAEEVIVSDSFARKHNLYPGQWVHVLLNNRRQRLFIVGTAISSEFVYMLGPGAILPDPEHFGVFYVRQRFAEEVFDFHGAANQIVGRLAPEVRDQPDPVLEQAEIVLEPYGVFHATPQRLQMSNQFLSSEIEGLGNIALIVPTVFLVVAALVLNVLMTRLARRQRTTIGTLKALGFTNWQVGSHFLKQGMSVGIIGGVAGCALGYLSSVGMTLVYQRFFEFPNLASGFYWQTHASGIAISILCSLAGSYLGARSVLRLGAAEAMRPEPPRRGGAIWLERFKRLWGMLSAPWRLALRTVIRHKLRSSAGMFAAAMGAGLLCTGFLMRQGQVFLIDFQFYKVARSDVDIVFHDELGRDALDEAARLPGVDWAEPQFGLACTFVNGPYRRKGGVTGLAPDARLTIPRDTKGRPIPMPASGLVLSRRLADILHAEPGDTITLEPIVGERRPAQATVAQVADSYLGVTAYADIHYLSRLMNEEFVTTGVQLALDGDPKHQAQLYRQLRDTPAVASVTARHDLIEQITDTLLKHQFIFIGLLITFSGVVFFGSIVNSSMVNLAERQREVATFLALGYDKWRIGNMFLRESLLINVTGALLGLPVGYGLMVVTAWSYRENDLIRFPVVPSAWIYLATLALALAFTFMAHAVVQWNIHRMNYLEALNVKE